MWHFLSRRMPRISVGLGGDGIRGFWPGFWWGGETRKLALSDKGYSDFAGVRGVVGYPFTVREDCRILKDGGL